MYQSRLPLKKYWPEIDYIKDTLSLQMQSYGLSMTPVSIEQLQATYDQSLENRNTNIRVWVGTIKLTLVLFG